MRSTPSASRKGNRFLDTESPDKQPSSRRPERPERVDGIDAASSESVPTLSDERGDSKEAAFSEEEARQLKADRSRHTLVFGIVVLAWLALDTLTKNYFNGSYSMGEVITGPLLGLVRFHLVHNTGAAWGMFGDSTFLLGVMFSWRHEDRLSAELAASDGEGEGTDAR